MTGPLQPSSNQPIAAARTPLARSVPPASVPAEQAGPETADQVSLSGASPTAPVFPRVTYVTDAQGATCQVKFIYDVDKRAALNNLTLMGSWDHQGRYSTAWKESAVPMKPEGEGKFSATVRLEPGSGQQFQWGVLADGPSGKQQWAMFGEEPPSFKPEPGNSTQVYAPRTFSQMGVTRQGENARVRFWAPKAENVNLLVWDKPDQTPRSLPLKSDPEGYWTGLAEGQWKDLAGKSYAYAVTADGATSLRNDPYARQLQGQLRGVGDVYLNPVTGQEVNKYYKTAEGQIPAHFLRFEVQQEPQAEKVFLRLFEKGQPLPQADLEKRLGLAGSDLVHKFGHGEGGFWRDHSQADGRIPLQRQGSDAWTTVLNHPEALQGLDYRFEVWKDGKLVGDGDGDGQLSVDEARKTAFNDPYQTRIENVGSQRFGVIRSDDFNWKNPAPNIEKRKTIIYQAHVGSFMGQADGARRSTFKDLIERLDYFKELGVNTIELLPTNPFEGSRDWGYLGTSSTATAEQYGFVDHDGSWVSGPDALKRFIDEAHGHGLAVMDDVVYNHFGGDFNNTWKLDGQANSYFNWGNGMKETPWGSMPAYNQPAVRQFVIDSAMAKLDDYRFDGLRFDFTHPMHDQGGGGTDGWKMLRELNRQVHFFHPNAFTAAEEFPNDGIVTTPAGPNLTGGAGFDAMWNTEFQHRLVHDGSNPAVLQQAASGQRTDMDKFVNYTTDHPGFPSPINSVTILSDHDEVGNADRTINVARNHKDTPPTEWERGMARGTFALGMLSPGIPMFFQGEESMAENTFKWGIPSTWDTGWEWKSEASEKPGDVARRQHFDCSKAAIALRQSSSAFDGDVGAQRVYSHNDNSVMALARHSGDEKFLVVASLNHNPQANYNIPIEAGTWQLVLNTDGKEFGGTGMGQSRLEGGAQAHFDLPAGAVLVYKKVA